MRRFVITGASSGLGHAIKERLFNWIDPFGEELEIIDWSLETEVDVSVEESFIKNLAGVAEAASRIETLDCLINCAGINEIAFAEKLSENEWDRVLNTNAKGIWLTAKHLACKMSGGTILNIVSNASHVPMTHSIAYNASKAAAHIMTQQMHRELFKTRGITVFGVSPNKLRGTGMSTYIERRVCELRGWSPEEAKKYQLAALPAGEETDPETLAEFIAFLLSSKERHRYLGGCVIPYGGP
jgi:NAD(P)-dependent dehydrogenase (short-subunit alcohol dehydrogenase family)